MNVILKIKYLDLIKELSGTFSTNSEYVDRLNFNLLNKLNCKIHQYNEYYNDELMRHARYTAVRFAILDIVCDIISVIPHINITGVYRKIVTMIDTSVANSEMLRDIKIREFNEHSENIVSCVDIKNLYLAIVSDDIENDKLEEILGVSWLLNIATKANNSDLAIQANTYLISNILGVNINDVDNHIMERYYEVVIEQYTQSMSIIQEDLDSELKNKLEREKIYSSIHHKKIFDAVMAICMKYNYAPIPESVVDIINDVICEQYTILGITPPWKFVYYPNVTPLDIVNHIIKFVTLYTESNILSSYKLFNMSEYMYYKDMYRISVKEICNKIMTKLEIGELEEEEMTIENNEEFTEVLGDNCGEVDEKLQNMMDNAIHQTIKNDIILKINNILTSINNDDLKNLFKTCTDDTDENSICSYVHREVPKKPVARGTHEQLLLHLTHEVKTACFNMINSLDVNNETSYYCADMILDLVESTLLTWVDTYYIIGMKFTELDRVSLNAIEEQLRLILDEVNNDGEQCIVTSKMNILKFMVLDLIAALCQYIYDVITEGNIITTSDTIESVCMLISSISDIKNCINELS